MSNSKALRKFSLGASLTNKELDSLLDQFERLDRDLREITSHYDEGFALAERQIAVDLSRLKGYKEARKR